MQAQREFVEAEPDETVDTIIFRPKAKMVKFRKFMVPLMYIAAALELLVALLGILIHSLSLAVMGATAFLFVGLIAWWFIKQTNAPRMKPVMTLSPEGFSVETDPFLGVIPWDEIASVHPGSLLGVPMVRIVPKNKAALCARLGAGGRWLWMYWEPKGGLGFSCIPFGRSPADLAARINRYRERGL